MNGVLAIGLLMILDAAGAGPDTYEAGVERWRSDRHAALKADDGWLTVAGLFWVRPGETTVGSDPGCDVVLPTSAPAKVGVLSLQEDGRASFDVKPGVTVKKAADAFTGGVIRSDAEDKADVLAVGDLRLILIKRGGRHAIRLKDNHSALREGFQGLSWYPVEPRWSVRAKFVPSPSKTRIVFDTIVGEPETLESPGFVEFAVDGKPYRLQAAAEGESLWFVFRDATSGKTTHPGARQLSADRPGPDGFVTLDFNKACNLPCAYTPHATCPLAPPQNRLTLAVTAGEQKYAGK